MTNKTRSAVRAAIYCRCSTDEQWRGKEFSTLESQAGICRHAVAMKEPDGWSLGKIYEDGGYSGGTVERPALQELLADVAAGHVQAVVVYRLDRLTRSIADFYELWKTFETHGVVFVSATEAFSTDTPTGELFLNLLLSLAQWERQLTQKRVRDKIAERSRQGYWNGGNPPYGYDYSTEKKLLAPHPREAPVVRNIFELIARYGSPVEVAKELNSDGITTRSRTVTRKNGKTEVFGGKRWIGQNVTRVVRNPVYRGVIVHNNTEYPARHEALVSGKLWKKANGNLVEKRVPESKTRRNNRHKMLLKGLLKCGHCGKRLVPKPAGKKDRDGNPYLYYVCGDINRHGKRNQCPLRNIPGRAFEEFVLKLLAELGKHPEVVKRTVEAAKKSHIREIKPLERKLAKVVGELEGVNRQVKALVEMAKKPEMKNLSADFMAGADALGARKSDLQLERQKLRMEIDYRRNLVTDGKIICAKLTDFTALFDELTFEEQAELLNLILKDVAVSRFDPEKDKHSYDPEVFVTQMRTSWYQLKIRFFSNSFSVNDLRRNIEAVSKVRIKGTSGGRSGIRTHGTVSRTLDFESSALNQAQPSFLKRDP